MNDLCKSCLYTPKSHEYELQLIAGRCELCHDLRVRPDSDPIMRAMSYIGNALREDIWRGFYSSSD